jgi:hypothetical protein
VLGQDSQEHGAVCGYGAADDACCMLHRCHGQPLVAEALIG